MAPVPLRLFQDLWLDYYNFFAHGVGAAVWGADECHRALYVILPGDRAITRIFTMAEQGNWSAPGHRSGWNGDLERPTFKPSIGTPNWHGYITHGELSASTCAPECCKVE